MNVQSLETPCLLLDQAKLQKNIDNMNARLQSHGVIFRPHVKTSKSIEITRMVHDGQVGPITVSTLKEAEYFFAAGFTDILYAVSIIPARLTRVKALLDKGCDLKLLLDDTGIARQVAAVGVETGVEFKVLIEIDSDQHRAGLQPGDLAVVALAKVLDQQPGVQFAGFMTHAGESYSCENTEQIKQYAQQEAKAIVDCEQAVAAVGIQSKIRSVGSTPTATYAQDLTGITEVRAGVYVFQDLYQAGLGVCGIEDIALSVLTTVISHKPDYNRLLIDAGGLALSKDHSTASQSKDCGYGLVCDLSGKVIDGLIVDNANQEHGLITSSQGQIDFGRFPIGSQLRILPNHACMTAAAYDQYYVVDGDARVQHVWSRCNGW